MCDFLKEFWYLHELFEEDMGKTLSSFLQIHRFVFSDVVNSLVAMLFQAAKNRVLCNVHLNVLIKIPPLLLPGVGC